MKNAKVSFCTIFKMKIIYILFIGICCAAIMTTTKYLFSDTANRHGDYLFIQTIQVENQAKDDFDYKGYLESPSNYYQFMRITEKGDFDFTKVDSAWNRKSQYEQMDWLKKKIQVLAFRDNVFEVSIHFDANVTRDVDYMKEHGDLLANDFITQSEKSLKAIKPDATFKTINKEASIPIVEPINRRNLAIKFAIIGFIIGIIGSSICFFLWAVAQDNRKHI